VTRGGGLGSRAKKGSAPAPAQKMGGGEPGGPSPPKKEKKRLTSIRGGHETEAQHKKDRQARGCRGGSFLEGREKKGSKKGRELPGVTTWGPGDVVYKKSVGERQGKRRRGGSRISNSTQKKKGKREISETHTRRTEKHKTTRPGKRQRLTSPPAPTGAGKSGDQGKEKKRLKRSRDKKKSQNKGTLRRRKRERAVTLFRVSETGKNQGGVPARGGGGEDKTRLNEGGCGLAFTISHGSRKTEKGCIGKSEQKKSTSERGG